MKRPSILLTELWTQYIIWSLLDGKKNANMFNVLYSSISYGLDRRLYWIQVHQIKTWGNTNWPFMVTTLSAKTESLALLYL